MIKGLTHNEDGVLNKITKYKGKISTGYAPGEGPNQTNHPVAAGFFRMLKQITTTERIGASKKQVDIKKWVENDKVQKDLCDTLPSCQNRPRRIEIVSLYKTPEEMWESFMAMYSSTDGLLCKSHGEGTPAMFLTKDADGNRERVVRKFEDGSNVCPFKSCPDYKSGKCKPVALLKTFPTVDMASQPYRFETRSLNTIIGVESSMQDLWMLMKAAHRIKEIEAGDNLQFDGFFGAKMFLTHRKVKSGGREVFITDLSATPALTTEIMEPIKRGLAQKSKQAALVGAQGNLNILGDAGDRLLALQASEEAQTDTDGVVPLDLADEQGIAVGFGVDAEEIAVDESPNEDEGAKTDGDTGARKTAAESLLGDNKK